MSVALTDANPPRAPARRPASVRPVRDRPPAADGSRPSRRHRGIPLQQVGRRQVRGVPGARTTSNIVRGADLRDHGFAIARVLAADVPIGTVLTVRRPPAQCGMVGAAGSPSPRRQARVSSQVGLCGSVRRLAAPAGPGPAHSLCSAIPHVIHDRSRPRRDRSRRGLVATQRIGDRGLPRRARGTVRRSPMNSVVTMRRPQRAGAGPLSWFRGSKPRM